MVVNGGQMNMTQWIGQLVVMVIIVGGAFLMGVSVGDAKGGKR